MKKSFILLTILSGFLVFVFPYSCAENEPLAPEPQPVSIETVIKAGPDEGAMLPNNITITFRWDGMIYPGEVTAFSYRLEQIINDSTFITIDSAFAMIRFYTKSNMNRGFFRFSVSAHGENGDTIYIDESPAVTHFSVAADTLAPEITILRGPEEGSVRATDSSIFFEWTATDPTPDGKIVSYSFALADSSVGESELNWSEPRLETTQMAYYKLEDGVYRFWLRATDISCLSTVISRTFAIR